MKFKINLINKNFSNLQFIIKIVYQMMNKL